MEAENKTVEIKTPTGISKIRDIKDIKMEIEIIKVNPDNIDPAKIKRAAKK